MRRYYPLLITLLILTAILLWLVSTRMTWPPSPDDQWPPADSASVTLVPEYIEPVVLPHNARHDAAAQGQPVTGPEAAPGQASGLDLDDAGPQAPVATQVTQKTPSPVKVKEPQKSPKDTGTPRKATDPSAQRARDIRTDVSGAFTPRTANSSGNNPSRPANPDGGNTAQQSTGVTSGIARIGNGWSLDHTGAVGGRGKPLGTVVIAVTVDAQGHVTQASAAGGTPPAATDRATIEECRRAALQSTFRLATGATAARSTHGTITWRFQ